MVGMSAICGPETRKSIFCHYWRLFVSSLGFCSWVFGVQVAPEDVELRQRRSQEVRGSLELQNGGLRALEEAWDDFLLEAFFCQV